MKEIDLLEKFIQNAVKQAIKEAFKEEIGILRKDLKEVKLLTAKMIKEVKDGSVANVVNEKAQKFEVDSSRTVANGSKVNSLMENLGRNTQAPGALAELAKRVHISSAAAAGEDLPDVDVPIEFFMPKR